MAGSTLGRRLANGDADVIRDLYREFGRPLYAVAYRMLGDPGLAEEAVQQSFLQAWRASSTFDVRREVAPWLFAITRRVAIDLHRRERRHIAEDVSGREPAVEPSLDVGWTVHEVRRAIEQLPEDERAVLAITHYGGLSHQEAAERLGIPPGTVKSRSHRAYRRLREQLAHLDEEVSL